MSERRAGSRNEEVHALRRDVTEQLESWERQLAAWPQAVAERVVAAVETAEERRAAQARTQQGRASWREQEQAQLTAQTQATERLDRLVWRLERQSATVLGWSRARWQGLLVGMVLTVVLVAIGLTGYWLVGPPSAMEAEVALYRRLWDVTTEAERARIRERLQSGRPSR